MGIIRKYRNAFKLVLVAGFAILGAAQSYAGEAAHDPDYFLISRDRYGNFLGSHKIFAKSGPEMHRVAYCGQTYWVRSVTVAWTEVEVEKENLVRVEFNKGFGWRPICDQPEKQVTLADIGIEENARYVLRTGGKTLEAAKRFSAIRDSFKTAASGNDRQKTSYHDE